MSSSSSPPALSFGDMLMCPVCFEMFDGRIFQCSQGHSVCERCQRQLNNECPQCRGPFVGTRNYVLEDLVKQLKLIKMSVTKNNDDVNGNDAGTSAESKDDSGDAESMIDNQKLTTVFAKLFASIPRPSTSNPEDDNASVSTQAASDRATVGVNLSVQIPISLNGLIAARPVHLGSIQPKGLFECRMLNCVQKLPICRMLNHILSFHPKNLTENRLPVNDDEFVMRYTFKCTSFRQAIRVSQFGLFFLIVNVRKETNNTKITSWVQCVGRSNECKSFTFNLQMRIGNNIAHYTDYTYGTSSGAEYIELKKQCLVYETNMTAKSIKELAVDVKITKATAERIGRRRNTTTVMPINN